MDGPSDSRIRKSVAGGGPGADLRRQIEAARRNPNLNLGRTVLLEELGHGGMGVVYRAWQEDLQRMLAVKVLPAHASEASAKRFLREARMVSKLRHPNIVVVHEMGEHHGAPWFAMDLVEGGSLDPLVRNRRMPQKRLLEILRDIARALDYAHGQGVVHRDIKPGNILIGADGTPYLTDFGLAGEAEGGERLTLSGAVMGTPMYMSPEQARGRQGGGIDRRTDVYSMGTVMYEGLTGHTVLPRGDIMEMVRQVVEAEPVPPTRHAAGISPDVETICLKCLRKDPAQRYQTAGALADDIDRFLAGEPISARPESSLGKLQRGAKKNIAWIAGGAAAAIALVVGLAIASRRGDSPPKDDGAAAALAAEREALARERAELEALRGQVAAATDPAEKKRLEDELRAKEGGGTGAAVQVPVKPDPPPVDPPAPARTEEIERRILALCERESFGGAREEIARFLPDSDAETRWRDGISAEVTRRVAARVAAAEDAADAALAGGKPEEAIGAWRALERSDLEELRTLATSRIAAVESARTEGARARELPLLDALKVDVFAAAARRKFPEALDAIDALARKTTALAPELDVLRRAVSRAAEVLPAAAAAAAKSPGRKLDLKTGPADIVRAERGRITVRDAASGAELTIETNSLDPDLLADLAAAGGASPEALGLFRLFEGRPDLAAAAWSASPEKPQLDELAASFAAIALEREARDALEALLAAWQKKDAKKCREILAKRERFGESAAWVAAGEVLGEIEYGVAEEKGELFAQKPRGVREGMEWRYDLDAAGQLRDWEAVEFGTVNEEEGMGFGWKGGRVHLRAARLRFRAPLGGDVRMSAEIVVREMAGEGIIAQEVGGYAVAVDRAGGVTLDAPDGRELQVEGGEPLKAGETCRIELSVGRAGVKGRFRDTELAAGPPAAPALPWQPRLTAFRGADIDVDRVTVAGGVPEEWTAEARRQDDLRARVGKVFPVEKPLVMTDGTTLGRFVKLENGTWTPGAEGVLGHSPNDNSAAELHWYGDNGSPARNFRMQLEYKAVSGRWLELDVRMGDTPLNYWLPMDRPGEWRTVEIVAVEEAVLCLVDGHFPIGSENRNARVIEGGIRVVLKDGEAVLRNFTMAPIAKVPAPPAWNEVFFENAVETVRLGGKAHVHAGAILGPGTVEFDAPPSPAEIVFAVPDMEGCTLKLQLGTDLLWSRDFGNDDPGVLTLRFNAGSADVLWNGVTVAKGRKPAKATGRIRFEMSSDDEEAEPAIEEILWRPYSEKR